MCELNQTLYIIFKKQRLHTKHDKTYCTVLYCNVLCFIALCCTAVSTLGPD